MRKTLRSCLALLVAMLCVLAACSQLATSTNPSARLEESDLVGIWVADYGPLHGQDQLVLRENMTFKQTYRYEPEGYVFESSWNRWRFERYPDGRVRIYLGEARYYPSGIREGEQEGVRITDWGEEVRLSYYDPYAKEFTHMSHFLILTVRLLESGEIVLAHMWSSPNDGADDTEAFRREASSRTYSSSP